MCAFRFLSFPFFYLVFLSFSFLFPQPQKNSILYIFFFFFFFFLFSSKSVPSKLLPSSPPKTLHPFFPKDPPPPQNHPLYIFFFFFFLPRAFVFLPNPSSPFLDFTPIFFPKIPQNCKNKSILPRFIHTPVFFSSPGGEKKTRRKKKEE